jgi:hypothetical protein
MGFLISPGVFAGFGDGNQAVRDPDLCGAQVSDGNVVTGADPVYRLEKL